MMLVLYGMEKGGNCKMQRTMDDTLKQYIAISIYAYTHLFRHCRKSTRPLRIQNCYNHDHLQPLHNIACQESRLAGTRDHQLSVKTFASLMTQATFTALLFS